VADASTATPHADNSKVALWWWPQQPQPNKALKCELLSEINTGSSINQIWPTNILTF